MKTCYAIASGEYSDYRVLAVAADKATADAWAAALSEEQDGWNSDAHVEEMVMLEAGEPAQKRHRATVMQDLFDDGTQGEMRVAERDDYPVGSIYGEPPRRPSVRFVRAPIHSGRGGRLEIEGRTLQGVMKVYSEQHAIWKSMPRAYKGGAA